MKELTLQEVLQIAGGRPDQATLDELGFWLPQTFAPSPAVPTHDGEPRHAAAVDRHDKE